MRLALVTDAWLPQTNGVVRTLSITTSRLQRLGHRVDIVEPGGFPTWPCPTYPEIRLAWRPYRRVSRQLEGLDPDCVHVATEGPLGMAARRWCLRHGRAFTTSYHTQFPEYVRARFPIPLGASYAWLRRFHGAAVRTMVGTPSMRRQLEAMACGVPVAAYPVTGPVDVVLDGVTGVLSDDLRAAALAALDLDPAECRRHALAHTWEAATEQFVANLASATGSRLDASAQAGHA